MHRGFGGPRPQAQSVRIRGDQRDAGQRDAEAWQRELAEMNALLQDCHAMNPARFQDQDDLPALPDDDDSTDDEQDMLYTRPGLGSRTGGGQRLPESCLEGHLAEHGCTEFRCSQVQAAKGPAPPRRARPRVAGHRSRCLSGGTAGAAPAPLGGQSVRPRALLAPPAHASS